MENQEKRDQVWGLVAKAHELDCQLVIDNLLVFQGLDSNKKLRLRADLTMLVNDIWVVENPDAITFAELAKLLN